ncbi:adenosylcobinamide-GDP ribazoletransferase [Marivita sp. S0852]|uniref:adenosylcobinamide-GDP ribazoletransferase n=1 Tax=Marivita sp. S0852 TaxID=3373893 RepID=UPI0039821DCB
MKAGLRSEWHVFLIAVQFLTRVPVPRDLPFSDELLIRATRYYPLVGCGVGAVGAGVLGLSALAVPMIVAVLLSMAATIFITGAFHEDGLADSADGLGGGMTRERALEIMRDSRIGTYGVVALGLTLALKAATLASFSVSTAAVALIVAHIISRAGAVHVIATDAYAREVGAKFVAPTVAPEGYRFAMLSGAVAVGLAVIWFGAVASLLAGVTAILAAAVFRAMLLRKLQGYTGDCLGGIQQLSEVGFYLGLALWL